MSAVFLHREGEEGDIPTFLDVRHVGGPPLHASSTEIRRALGDRKRWRYLCTLPFDTLVSICGNRLYDVGACTDLLNELHPLLRDAVDATALLPQSDIAKASPQVHA